MKMFCTISMAFSLGVLVHTYWPNKPQPIWKICFDYNLTINQDISEDTKKAIKDSLSEATSKIAEACALVEQSK